MLNTIWPRFLKNAYRKEPITGFILAVGAVDAILGGAGQRWTLLTFGVTVVAIAAFARWLQIHNQNPPLRPAKARYYLPERSSGVPLPRLREKKNLPSKDF